MRSLLARFLAPLLFVATAMADPVADLAKAMDRYPVVLLGEIHDNVHHHRLRAAALAHRIAAGWRPALVMEQFDRERQPDIERARQERPRDADHLIAQATANTGGAWLWAEYRPFVQLALDNDLPLLAGNVSRSELARVRQAGLAALGTDQVAALGLDRPLPADIRSGLEAEINRGHCYQAPRDLLPALALNQAVRDAWMAYLVRQSAARGVVLVAGNGHVRKDIGVPRWLAGRLGQSVLAVGFLERGRDSVPGNAFDLSFDLPPTDRPDPCAAFGPPPAPATS